MLAGVCGKTKYIYCCLSNMWAQRSRVTAFKKIVQISSSYVQNINLLYPYWLTKRKKKIKKIKSKYSKLSSFHQLHLHYLFIKNNKIILMFRGKKKITVSDVFNKAFVNQTINRGQWNVIVIKKPYVRTYVCTNECGQLKNWQGQKKFYLWTD